MVTENTKLLRRFILAMLSLFVIGSEGEIRAQPKDIVEGAKKDLDAEELWPFYARAEELGVPIIIHLAL
jgi:hypothetical protein